MRGSGGIRAAPDPGPTAVAMELGLGVAGVAGPMPVLGRQARVASDVAKWKKVVADANIPKV